jgi:hypothetical protein
MSGRQFAIGLLAAYVFLLALVTAAVSAAENTAQRVVGHGQIKFNGAGPELWAARWRRQRKLTIAARRELTTRISRVVWLVDSFQCIHRGEGGWEANTGNGYFGGLQMDRGFQSTYAPDLVAAKGTADNWTPSEQIATAMVAYTTRGFYPWPNTARACGLIR